MSKTFLEQARDWMQRLPGEWELWTGCSWRRVGIKGTQETVIEPLVAGDGWPDLRSKEGVEFAIYAHNIWPEIVALYERMAFEHADCHLDTESTTEGMHCKGCAVLAALDQKASE